MAALSAAFELSRTPALQDRFEVTLYQLGWRLGGKAASGRATYGRIVEHGLHVWFGCYENTFGILREAYKDWKPQDGQSITEVNQASRFRPKRSSAPATSPSSSGCIGPHCPTGSPESGSPIWISGDASSNCSP